MGTHQFDVMVIGEGQSGLQTARYLSEAGLSVALFDENSEIGKDVVCSGVISKEAFFRYDLPEEAVIGRLQHAELFCDLRPGEMAALADLVEPVFRRLLRDGS